MSGSNGLVFGPTILQPTAPGQIVGLDLQNTGGTATPVQPLTFGEVFQPGAVMPGQQLVMQVGSQSLPVQMDAKTFNSDGSVASATLTVMAPALAPNSTTGAMLALAPPGASPPPPVDLATALGNYSLLVNLNGHDSQGVPINTNIDAVAALKAALANGTASYWEQGPIATEASVRIPVDGSFYLNVSITAYANGTFSSNVQFNNDIAMGARGGTVFYQESIVQNGQVVSQQNNLTQYQYQDWNQVVGTSGPTAQVNIQHDIAYLEATGAIPNYDLSAGVSSSVTAAETSMMTAPGWGAPFSPDGITQYMPGVGGRADIGPTTQWNAAWLMTQDPTTEQFALGQADAAAGIPWHFFYPAAGQYLTTNDYPNIWTYANNDISDTVLTQTPSSSTGWTVDTAHQPDLDYVSYLLTGNQYYLDQLNAQATWAETSTWPDSSARNNGQGLIVQNEQVRAAAWDLREITEAAYANPAGSPMQEYFQQMEDNNYSWLVSQIPTWTAQEGQAYGYLPGGYGNPGAMAPWQQDYLASSVVMAAEQGNADAKTFLEWESNFLVGRFLNGANGFNPHDGIAYNLDTYNPATGQDYTTWAQIEAATEAAGNSNGSGWSHSDGDYGQLAVQSLAGIITVTGSPQAIEAYGWLLGSGAPYVDAASLAASPQFDIVPRLSDGNLLTGNNVILSQDTTPTTIQGTNNDQLIEAGSGNDTVLGGTGINLLFGGSGNDVLVGGVNNDYIYGGTGSDTISAGAGSNFLQSGGGSTTFLFDTADAAANTLDGFRPGIDHLDIMDASGTILGTSALQAILATATTNAAGDAVLALSASNTLTLTGVPLSALGLGIFGTTLPPGIPAPAGGSGGGTSGGGDGSGGNGSGGDGSGGDTVTLDTSGNHLTGGASLLTVVDHAGGNTVSGGSGGLDLTQTAGADLVTTAPGATDTLNLVGADTVSAGGNDMITAAGAAHVTAGSGSLSFVGGAGTSTIIGGSGAATITGGAGGVSVAGGAGNMLISNGGGHNTVTAGTGNITLQGGAGALTFIGGPGTASITEGSGAAAMMFGSGNATVTAGSGVNLFTVRDTHGGNAVTINNFQQGLDFISFHGFAGDPVSSYSWGTNSETLNLSDGTRITLNFSTH